MVRRFYTGVCERCAAGAAVYSNEKSTLLHPRLRLPSSLTGSLVGSFFVTPIEVLLDGTAHSSVSSS
jgi:hypothetical protein